MRLYRVLVVAEPTLPAARLERVRELLASHGLQVEVLDDTAGGSGRVRDLLRGYSGVVVLDDVPIADPLVVAAVTAGLHRLDLRGRDAVAADLDDWSRTVLPMHGRPAP